MDTTTDSMTSIRLGVPAPERVRAWLVDANDAWVAPLSECLSEDERADIERLVREGDRAEAAVARGLWRSLAGEALGCDPSLVEVERTPFGRPLPMGLARTKLDLSVAHSAQKVLVGASMGMRLGVDIELVIDAVRDDRVAQAIEGIQGPALELVADSVERSMLRWCVFEALIKADGRGLHLDPGMVSTELRSLWGWNQARVAGTLWWVRRLEVPGRFVGALAAGAPVEQVELIDLGPSPVPASIDAGLDAD